MTYVVHKAVFGLSADIHERDLPMDSEFLCVREQHGALCLWYRWNTEITAKTRHRFALVGTGNACPDRNDGEYVGTAMFYDGDLVLHLFHKALS